jgi:hypothetical protein
MEDKSTGDRMPRTNQQSFSWKVVLKRCASHHQGRLSQRQVGRVFYAKRSKAVQVAMENGQPLCCSFKFLV